VLDGKPQPLSFYLLLLISARTAPYTFNTHASASLISSTGPFLHLSYARLCSAITSLTTNIYPEITPLTLDHTTPHAQTLLSHLVHFPSVLALTLKTHEPSVLVTYLMRFTHAINASYEELEKQEVGARRGLLEAVRNVLLGGMEVLGCRPDGKDDNSKVSQEYIMD
jgi:arginyl-tRNA synthetase